MAHASMASRVRRGAAVSLLGALLLGSVVAAPAQAAKPFDPKVTVSRSSNAARAATSFGIKITQTEGEEQIGALKLNLPRNPGFVVQTNVAGDYAQIGTIQAILYTGPSPGTPLTIDGTLHDDNDHRAGCGVGFTRQCVLAKLHVPSQPDVEAQFEIYEDPNGYRIETDLTGTWADDSVAALQGRLSELSATLSATVGPNTVVRNPATAGTLPFTWDFTSAAVPDRGYTGGLKPPCASTTCSLPVTSVEFAPSLFALQTPPAATAFFVTPEPTSFSWAAATDANGDPVTYTLVVDDADVVSGPGLSATKQLAAGSHSWKVRAADDHGGVTTSATRTLTVLDPNDAQVFTSIISGDKLYIVPGAFMYVIPNYPYALGSESASAAVDRGAIVFNGGFTLAIAYDTATGVATGYLNHGRTHREFIDLPG